MQGRCKGLTHYLFLVCRALIFKKNNFPAAQYNDTVQQEIKKDDFHINGDRPSSTNGGDSERTGIAAESLFCYRTNGAG